MRIQQFIIGTIVASTAILMTACASSPSRSDDAADKTRVQLDSVPRLHQAPDLTDGLVIGKDGLLACRDGLEEQDLDVTGYKVDRGDTWVSIDWDMLGNRILDPHSISTFVFSGKSLDIKAAYVIAENEWSTVENDPTPGVVEKEFDPSTSYSHRYGFERDFPAKWEAGMEKGFGLDSRDWGHGHNNLTTVVICLQTSK